MPPAVHRTLGPRLPATDRGRIEAGILLLVVLAACGPSAGARECRPGFVESARIETEADIADLPPVDRVRRLEIVGSDLESLAGLECIEWVETLRIENNEKLRTLSGLDGLLHVDTQACADATPTERSQECNHYPLDAPRLPPGEGDVTIVHNPRLESMAGLDSLLEVRGEFAIRDNAALVSLDGLQSLLRAAFSGSSEPVASFRIENNPLLRNLDALKAYNEGDRLDIRNNVTLTRLFPVDHTQASLPVIRSLLVLEDLPQVENLDSLSGWTVVGLELRRLDLVEELPDLVTFPGFFNYIDRLVLEENPALRSLARLPPLSSVNGQLVIRDNDALLDLTGLESIEGVGGYLYEDLYPATGVLEAILIEGNAELRSLDALDPSRGGSFRMVSEELDPPNAIRDNAKLPTCLVEEFLEVLYEQPAEDVASWVFEGNGEGSCP